MNYALRTAIGATTIAATLALTGCMKLGADVSLSGDDTFSGDVVIAFSDEMLEQMDTPPDEFLEGMTEGTVDASEYETVPYAEDGYSGFTAIFEDAPFNELEEVLDIKIDHEGDDLVVEGDVIEEDMSATGDEASPGIDPLGDELPGLDAILESMRYEIAITFPGPVSYTNGEVDGTTVTWESTGGEPLTVEARASALTQEELDEIARAEAEAQAIAEREALIRKILIGAGIVVGAALFIGLGIFFGKRAARTSTPAEDGDGDGTAGENTTDTDETPATPPTTN